MAAVQSTSHEGMTQAEIDAAELARISGHRQELQRTFSPLSMIGFAFAILNSWTALSASLSVALPSGGYDVVSSILLKC